VTPALAWVNAIDLSDLVSPAGAKWRLVDVKAIAMDTTILSLLLAPLVLGLVVNAVKFMRFVGFVAGGGSRSKSRTSYANDHLTFDERVAERLRELDRERQ
jgi:hypothetical protein